MSEVLTQVYYLVTYWFVRDRILPTVALNSRARWFSWLQIQARKRQSPACGWVNVYLIRTTWLCEGCRQFARGEASQRRRNIQGLGVHMHTRTLVIDWVKKVFIQTVSPRFCGISKSKPPVAWRECDIYNTRNSESARSCMVSTKNIGTVVGKLHIFVKIVRLLSNLVITIVVVISSWEENSNYRLFTSNLLNWCVCAYLRARLPACTPCLKLG